MSTLEESGYDGGHESGASTYDGDISSANASTKRWSGQQGHSAAHYNSRAAGTTRPTVANASSSASTVSLGTEASPPPAKSSTSPKPESEDVFLHPQDVLKPKPKAPFHAPAPHGMMSRISPEELQQRMLDNIAGGGPDGVQRPYKINKPPAGRPIRIYADGVYDLFHYAHALALRQAKLFFPDVYLLVGVVSDELVRQYKATPVLTSEERYESVRNCKWVDEVVEDAPWVVDAEFLEKHQIDYVAHDEEPYQSAGSEDVYQFVKDRGQFIPTRRTSGISTSELLQRIVEGYRGGDYDSKLVKIGHPELCSEAGSVRSQRSGRPASDEAQASRPPSVPPSPTKQI